MKQLNPNCKVAATFRTLTILLAFSTASCNDLLEVSIPSNQITRQQVFNDDITATAAVTGIYYQMIYSAGIYNGSSTSPTYLCGLSADELALYSPTGEVEQFQKNKLSPINGLLGRLWSRSYFFIYLANNVIEGLAQEGHVNEALKQQLTGEAMFIRAFCHFMLVSLFGDIPYVMSTDYRENLKVPRLATSQVYIQIKEDLLGAQQLLPNDYSFAGNERIRPGKWAAKALLARVCLYTGEWELAAALASEVIDSGLFSLTPLEEVFLKNSDEAIWQLKPVTASRNTFEGFTFIPAATPAYAIMTESLTDAFEEGDARKETWTGTATAGDLTFSYPHKYKIRTGDTPLEEYSMVLRLAEVYLIRAEANFQLGRLDQSTADIDQIRKRSGLQSLALVNQGVSLDVILHERRVELFTEWGHRWMDLKRTGRAESVLSSKPDFAIDYLLYPIPESEVQTNLVLVQNPGY